ncbi:MAG: peroxiredoxin family protein [Actinomycetota bacterium]
MQQVVDLQNDKAFQRLDIELLSISPDSVSDWKQTVTEMGIHLPVLSDDGNRVAGMYGVMRWRMGNEPGHTFVLVDREGRVAWLHDYGAPEHGGLMYVEPGKIIREVGGRLSS